MSKDAWSAGALWFQFGREGAGCGMVQMENNYVFNRKMHWASWSSCDEEDQLVLKCCMLNGSRLLRGATCVERAAWCCAQTVLFFSVVSPCLVLRWRHEARVERPKTICLNKMTQFVYALITEPRSRTSRFDCYYSWYKMPLIWALQNPA